MTNIGRKLYGYCGGVFGRSSYDDKRIEAEGYNWIVVREDDGRVLFTDFANAHVKEEFINEYSKPDEE